MKTWILSFIAAFLATGLFAPDIGIAFVSAIVIACLNAIGYHGIMWLIGAYKCPFCHENKLEVTSVAASCNGCGVVFRRNAA